MKPTSNPFLSGAIAVAMTLPALADTTITQGINNIDTTGNPDLGVITRNPGGIALFNTAGTATATGPSNTNGILGPWAIIGTGTASRYATISGGNIVGFTGGTSANFGWASGNNNTWNYDVTGPGGSGNVLGVNRVANTARYTGGAVTQFWGNNNTTTITLNGLMNAGSGALTFAENGGTNHGQLAVGTNNSHELVLHAANAAININIPIINTGANAGSIVVSGPNTITFSGVGGANTYSGGTTVASGTLTLISGATPGASGSTLHIASGAQVTNNGGSVQSHTVTGGGSFTSTGSTSVDGDWSGFTGTYTHNSSTASSVFNTATATSSNAAYVISSVQGSSQGMIAAGNGNYTLQMGSLSGVANSLFRGGNSATGTTTLQVGNLDTNTTFAGIIANGATKTMALEKVGTGALTLSGANTYTGDTVVSAGTLLVNGSLGNSAVSVEAAATIGGTGALAGNLTMDATSFFKVVDISDPLSVAGTITFGSGFGIENITGVDWASLTKNTPHTLISTSQVFTSADIANFGLENAADLGGGLFAYFENGSLAVVVIPEPAVTLLGCFGILGLLRRRR